jgi:bifunctional non-homologous end joining protein LigD
VLSFVVQKHAARRLHYDFRLELDGVLKSWAVPKGPAMDPKEKRLAVAVEDHPLEYAGFEGTIPAGNYGAGAVIVWDRGSWVPLEDPAKGLEKGKLLFELHGYKLQGVWTLVRTARSPKDWLLIKHGGAEPSADESSVLSGLTIEDLQSGTPQTTRIEKRLRALDAPRRVVSVASIGLMLAEPREQPFSKAGWLYELKYDGFRLLVAREDGKAKLLYRRGSDSTALFPEIAAAVRALPFEGLVMDSEVVVLDEGGRPDFQRLQKRAQLSRAIDIEHAAVSMPATAFVFDLLACEGFDLRALPLIERKALLREILPPLGALRYTDHVEKDGQELFREIEALGLEGMIAKRASSPYGAGRSSDWQKIRRDKTADLAIVGFTEPGGGRAGLGALHLGAPAADGLRYAGRVGTGFDDALLRDLRRRLEPRRRPTAPCSGDVPRGRSHVWVEPELVCEVRFREWTEDGHLRHPVFLRLREDKSVADCTGNPAPPPVPAEPPRPVPERLIHFTNLDKVFWADEGYTKGDLIEYYRGVAPWLLPYLRDRPLVLTRFPDGIAGKSFYQKDAPGFVPDWIRTERVWSEHAGREIDYFVCDDVESLVYLVNLGTIPLHLWSSRSASLERPDWCVLDLDPKGAPFTDVVEVARSIHRLCDDIDLPCFAKTSGSTGLHVLVPLGGQLTHDQSRALGELLSQIVHEELPEITTMARKIADRGGKVYLDYLQNRHGQTIAAPFSARPLAGAPVSTPLRWSEVTRKLDPGRFTIRTIRARFERLDEDPMSGVLRDRPDLGGVLERLGRRATASK